MRKHLVVLLLIIAILSSWAAFAGFYFHQKAQGSPIEIIYSEEILFLRTVAEKANVWSNDSEEGGMSVFSSQNNVVVIHDEEGEDFLVVVSYQNNVYIIELSYSSSWFRAGTRVFLESVSHVQNERIFLIEMFGQISGSEDYATFDGSVRDLYEALKSISPYEYHWLFNQNN